VSSCCCPQKHDYTKLYSNTRETLLVLWCLAKSLNLKNIAEPNRKLGESQNFTVAARPMSLWRMWAGLAAGWFLNMLYSAFCILYSIFYYTPYYVVYSIFKFLISNFYLLFYILYSICLYNFWSVYSVFHISIFYSIFYILYFYTISNLYILYVMSLELIIWITQKKFIRFSNYKLIFHPLVLNKTGEQELACSSTSLSQFKLV